MRKEKIRVNITVDEELLEKAKKRLDLFGGKLSTLFNNYLREFNSGIGKEFGEEHKALLIRLEEIERKLQKLRKEEK